MDTIPTTTPIAPTNQPTTSSEQTNQQIILNHLSNNNSNNSSDEITKIMADPEESKQWVIELLSDNNTDLAIDIRNRLKENIIDGCTDLLLRTLGNLIPYNFIVPSLRYNLGLTYTEDEQCVDGLNKIRKHVDNDGENLINNLITFVQGDIDVELDDDIIPEMDLLALSDQIPLELLNVLYNCIDYINEISF